jgi:hypothetical protein
VAKRCLPLLCVFVLAAVLHADGPGDNFPDKVRPVPPPGIAIEDAERAQLQAEMEALGKEIEQLRQDLKGKPAFLELLPDVQIRPLRPDLQRVLQSEGTGYRAQVACSGPGTRSAAAGRQNAMDHGDGPGGAWLSIED